MIPTDTIRQAVYTAINSAGGYTAYTSPPKTGENFILIDEIRVMEDIVQDVFTYDVGITIEVVTRYEKRGSVKTGSVVATAIDAIMRPTSKTFMTITGWDVVSMRLDATSETQEITADAKVFREVLNYFIRVMKQ